MAGNETSKCDMLTEFVLVCLLFQEVGLVDYHAHHVRDYSSHLAQPHRRRPSLLSEFQPGSERLVRGAFAVPSALLAQVKPTFSVNEQDPRGWTSLSKII